MKRLYIIFGFGILIFGITALAAGCGQGGSSSATTTTSTTSTTTSTAGLRLYYSYTAEATAPLVYVGSAYSAGGITFAVEALPRFSSSYLTQPDVVKLVDNTWRMFYSRSLTSEVLEKKYLYVATAESAAGTFVCNGSVESQVGNKATSIKINDVWHVYTVSSGNILLSTYEASSQSLDSQGTVLSGGSFGLDAPAVVKVTTEALSPYKLFYNYDGNVYMAESTNGSSWRNAKKIVADASDPGAVYLNQKIYLYYNNNASPAFGAIYFTYSTNEGQTFENPVPVYGLPVRAAYPDPVEYE